MEPITVIEKIENVENFTVNINLTLTLPVNVEAEVNQILRSTPTKKKRKTGPKTGSNEKRKWLYAAIQDGKIKADEDGKIYRKNNAGEWKLQPLSQQGKAIFDDKGNVIGHRGYLVFGLTYKGQTKIVYAHEAVWMYHNGLIPQDKTIDHIDYDKTNNHLDNLRLVSLEENIQMSFNEKQRPYMETKRALRAAMLRDYELGASAKTLAQFYGYTSIKHIYLMLRTARKERGTAA